MFEYEFIRGINSPRYGLEWEFKNKKYIGNLVDILNILGKDGWQMTVKTGDFKYILMRNKEYDNGDD